MKSKYKFVNIVKTIQKPNIPTDWHETSANIFQHNKRCNWLLQANLRSSYDVSLRRGVDKWTLWEVKNSASFSSFFRSFVTYEIDKEKKSYHINWLRKVIKSLIGNFYCEFKKLAIIIIFSIDVHCCTKTSLKSSSYHDKDKKEPVLKRVGQ